MRKIDANPCYDRVAAPLQQNTAQLGLPNQNIVRPFQRESDFRRAMLQCFMNGDSHHKCQSSGLRIIWLQPDDRAGIAIAKWAVPAAPHAPAPVILTVSTQPQPLRRAMFNAGEQIGIGGAGCSYFFKNRLQNSAFAA